jgi:endonuclease-3
MPVDTHVFRVARRLGLIDARTSVEKAHEILESLVPPKSVYEFHMLMVQHGRRTCKAQRPRCAMCVLRGICPSAQSLSA